MSSHPYHDVAITGVFNTEQARVLEGEDSMSIAFKGGLGALADAGVGVRDVDGVVGQFANDFVYQARLSPVWVTSSWSGIPAILQAATAIAAGMATKVLVLAGTAGVYVDRASTAPWTRPTSEFVAPYGMFTAAEFALVARRHMHRYGTKPEALAAVASVIRNNGHVHPGAIYRGRGPFTPQDILDSRMVADPFHLLDCATASEGGCGLVLTRADLAAEAPRKPVYVLGGNGDSGGAAYKNPPTWELGGHRRADWVNGTVGRRAAEDCFRTSGLAPTDVDVCEFYDPFSFEIIRQYEAFGFCGEGEGGDFVTSGAIEPGGQYPVTTDGGVMSYSHAGASAQMLQRVIRGVEQLRGECETNQAAGAEGRDVLERWFGSLVHRRDAAGSRTTVSLLQPQTGTVSVPHPSLLTQPYWDGCARGQLLFQRCAVCGHATHTPAYLCSNCTAQDLTWEASAGTGEIYSWTTVWRPQMPTFEVPYVAIIVDMDEGWQILSNLIGCEHDAVEIGTRVAVEFHEIEGGFTLPYFRPTSTGGDIAT